MTVATIMAGNVSNEVRSIQERLEKALSQANEPISVFVPAELMPEFITGQVVHFETTAHRKDAAWTMGVIPIYHKILPFVG